MAQTVPFTAVELTNIRRYCGYPAYAAFGYTEAPEMAKLDTQCADMSDQEQAVIRTVFLPNLSVLELAIFGSGANLDTDQAAVWYHNKNEVSDRIGLYNRTRRELCIFIGCAPGDSLRGGASVVRS